MAGTVANTRVRLQQLCHPAIPQDLDKTNPRG